MNGRGGRRVCGRRRGEPNQFVFRCGISYKTVMALDYRSLSRGELIRLLEVRDRRRLARARAEERYRSVIDQAADGIFIADERGIFLEVNASGAQLLGLPPGRIVGRHIRELVVPEDIPTLEADLASLRRKKVYRTERRLRRQDGSIIP